MHEQTYAIVVYLRGPLAELVDGLRCRLDPAHVGKTAHITVLPPRPLVISEQAALEEARAQCEEWEPFEVRIGGISTFLPANGVVYMAPSQGREQMRRLHSELNRGHLASREVFGYVPHITIVQDLDEQRTHELERVVAEELARYDGPRRFLVETLTFVRQAPSGEWIDLAEVQLGRQHVLA